MAAELLEPGRVHAAVHAGGQRAALEAVAAEGGWIEAGRCGAGLQHAGHGAGIDGLGAEPGQGGLAAVPTPGR